jgi:integrase/recombinase XerD
MSKPDLLGSWVRRFLVEYLVGERHFAENTRRSYRDTLALLIPFIATATKISVDRLRIGDLTADGVRQFLHHLEQSRGCCITTRNQRLAALHSPHDGVCYLEKPEMDALLDAPNQRTRQGFRDHAVLLFLYNSGARASEAVGVTVGDLDLSSTHQASVRLMGKGSKVRRCPLWASTAGALKTLIGDRSTLAAVFVNRRGQPLTRYGVHDLVARYGRAVARRLPSLQQKRVSPHTIRHTTATHLLRAGVDINTIRAWLGHVSLDTTNIYAEIDLAAKAKALETCAIQPDAGGPPVWKDNKDLLVFLRSL